MDIEDPSTRLKFGGPERCKPGLHRKTTLQDLKMDVSSAEKKIIGHENVLKINLEDRQTKLEAQIKSLQDQIDSTSNRQSLNNWPGDQVNKI